MFADLAQRLAQRLLPEVPPELANRIAAYDWQTAQVVERGKDHVLLIAEGLAVARIPRRDDPDFGRKMRLLQQLALPWQVPVPLSQVDGGVIQPFLPGTAHPHGSGDPDTLASIVESFADYDTSALKLNEPFAQRGRFTPAMLGSLEEVVEDRSVWAIAEHVHGWTDDRTGAGLVHGDLAGHNMHWIDGELASILDWDYAAVWDTALNATYLSLWHGVAPEEFSATPHRARVWSGALGMYALADALSWDISPAGWRRLNNKVQPRIRHAVESLAFAEA